MLSDLGNQALSWVMPLMIISSFGFIAYQAFQFVLTLSVVGRANQWVLIINNGVLKKAGVGLNCFRSPGDVVAYLPTKVNKVQFTAEQVTQEMSGVVVSAMICWTINREGDGPLKAYTNLGSDISSNNPREANALISSIASAVMRNRISNTKMDDVLTNR